MLTPISAAVKKEFITNNSEELEAYLDTNNSFDDIIVIRNVKTNDMYFIAKEIAKSFEYKETRNLYDILDADESELCSYHNLNKIKDLAQLLPNQTIPPTGLMLINESGLNHAAFNSGKSKAKEFRKYVTEILLPTIRKTGSYSINTDQKLLEQITTQLSKLTEEIVLMRGELNELKPKAITFDLITKQDDAYSMEEGAKLLRQQYKHLPLQNLTRNTLLDALRRNGVVNYKNIAYQNHINSGNFIYKYSNFEDVYGKSRQQITSTLITNKGLVWVVSLLKKEGLLPIVLFDNISSKKNTAIIPVAGTNTIQ